MAARRLLIVMVVLLIASSVAAALVPTPEPEQPPPEGGRTDEGRPPPEAREPRGRLVRAQIEAGGRREELDVRVGDQLVLAVRSGAGQVEIPAFGLIATAAPDAPARFDLLLDRAGDFPVRFGEPPRAIATIRAEPRAASRSARPDAARARAGARREPRAREAPAR